MTNWQIETIPNESFLFYRIHRSYIFNNQLMPSVFRDIGIGMSTNWEKYSSAEECREMSKVPEDNGIVKLNAGDIRTIINHIVNHTPNKTRSHTDVIGIKDTEARLKYCRIFQWIIPI